jgi:monothiol glutaredoxin
MSLDPALKSKLETLVKSDAVVLFMKGNRSFPQCGFSASVVNILNTMLPKYTTVNVLADGEVREGMKQLSDWPTFPQLYIRGEFVGGADIVRQMSESGELAKKLGDLVAPIAPPKVTVTPRAAQELQAALAEAGPSDVIHLTIPPSWDHQLDMGAREAKHVTVEAGGLTVQLDPASAGRANGVVIDFVDGPGGAGFKIDNPNRPAAVRQIGAKELRAMLDAGTIGELYDVRTAKEMATASIAQGKPLDEAAVKRLEGLPKDTPLAFYCHHGNRSNNAAEHFLREGFTKVYNLKGGIDAWSLEVDPEVPRY